LRRVWCSLPSLARHRGLLRHKSSGVHETGSTSVGAEVLVHGSVLEHVIDGRENRSCDGDDGFCRTAPCSDAVKLGVEVAVFRACRRPGALHERALEPGGAFAYAGRSALTCTLVVARADASPGDQVTAGGKSAHIGTDLGDDYLCTEVLDPWH